MSGSKDDVADHFHQLAIKRKDVEILHRWLEKKFDRVQAAQLFLQFVSGFLSGRAGIDPMDPEGLKFRMTLIEVELNGFMIGKSTAEKESKEGDGDERQQG